MSHNTNKIYSPFQVKDTNCAFWECYVNNWNYQTFYILNYLSFD